LLQEWTSTYYTNSDIVDILFEFQGEIEINLEKQSVKADNKTYHFDVDSERKEDSSMG
jgi:3-isopropylmalate dehydratase small subunit